MPILRFEDTDKAGPYEATIKTDPPVLLKFAAQFNPEESNLAGLVPAQLESLESAAEVIHWAQNKTINGRIAGGGSGSGGELWTILAIRVLVAACAESLLSAFFSAVK